MAFELVVRGGNIEVILYRDSLVTCTREEYDEYLKSFGNAAGCDEDFLKLSGPREEATRFVLRRSVPFDKKQWLRGKNIAVKQNDVELNANYSIDLVRAALIDVLNPAGVPDTKAIRFKRDKDGMASGDLINKLDDAGVLTDLVAAYSNATATEEAQREHGKNS